VLYKWIALTLQNAYVNFYPEFTAVEIHGRDNLTTYVYDIRPELPHMFCKICGVPVCIDNGAVTLRVLDNLDWSTLKIKSYKGSNQSPAYKLD